MRNLKWTKNMLELFFGPFLNFLIRPKLFHVAPPYDSFIENAHEKSSLNLQLSTPMQGFSSTPYRGVWDVNSAFIMLGASCCQGADVRSSSISTDRALQRYIKFLKLTSILQVFLEKREKKFENPSWPFFLFISYISYYHISCGAILMCNYQIDRWIENAVTMGGNWQKALSREM